MKAEILSNLKKDLWKRVVAGATVGVVTIATVTACNREITVVLPTQAAEPTPTILFNPTINVLPTPTTTVAPKREDADDFARQRHETPTPTPEVMDFAKTASEAAAKFGTDSYSRNPTNWEPTAENSGWHMKEDGSRHNLNLNGFVGQGYWDTLPGKNAQNVVANGGTINVQGATVWKVQGERAAQVLYNQMGINSWSDGTVHTPTAIGFTPNSSVGFNQ